MRFNFKAIFALVSDFTSYLRLLNFRLHEFFNITSLLHNSIIILIEYSHKFPGQKADFRDRKLEWGD